jgi:signal transduction histidine kinase/Tfp pilus assembly protein PilF
VLASQYAAVAENTQPTSDVAQIDIFISSAKKNIYKNYNSAIADLTGALNLAKGLDDKNRIFNVYRNFGFITEKNNRLKEALQYYTLALSLEKMVSDSAKMDVYLDLAIINKKLGNYTAAKEFYDKTLQLASSKGDFVMVEYANNGLGTLYKNAGEYDKAVEYYLKSVKDAEARKNTKDVVISKMNTAEVYLKAKNFGKALSIISETNELALTLKAHDRDWLGNVLNVYGTIYTAQNDYNNALEKHRKALQIFEELGSKRDILISISHLSEVFTQLNQLDTVEAYLKRCFEYKNYFQYADEPNFYYKLGILYKTTKRYDLATVNLEQSLELANKRNFKELIQLNNRALSELYNFKGDFKKAYAYLKIANMYNDSLSSDEKLMRMAEINFKFDLEKIQNQKEKEIQSLKSKQLVYLGGGAIAIMFFITLSLFYFLRLKSKNNILLLNKNDEIKLQNEKLEKSNEILRQFAYASAHDLKEPLRSISSFIHIIQRRYGKLLPPESEEYMNFVTSGVKRMETLLSALLEYSTVASDLQVIANPTSIAEVLNDVKDNLHVQITNKNAVVESSGILPSVLVSKLHLTQLFQNLISNSMKFTNKPPVIKIEGVLLENEILIKIQDNGIGIKKEYSDKIFHLFHRLSRAPQYEGSGIGLTICKNIVDKYDGKIWFESVEGEGTTFFIAFPIGLVKSEHAIENKQASSILLKSKI